MYHTITYGKGNMGSHATQLNPTQRWSIIRYLRYLAVGNVETAQPTTDSTMTEEAGVPAK